MMVEIYSSYEQLSNSASDKIIETVKKNPAAVLCFATGSTPVLTYEMLVKKVKAEQIDFSQCTFIELDEWVGLPQDVAGSCFHSLNKLLFQPLQIHSSRTLVFNAMANDEETECKKMNEALCKLSTIDLMLVGVGLNGHIGFNEPGTEFDTTAHVALLHPLTVETGKKYFSGSTPPGKGFTLGLKNVLDAKLLLVLANGDKKSNIIQQAIEGEVTKDIPATIVQQHSNAVIILDEAAASLLKN